METMKEKEINDKKAKRKLMLTSALITLIMIIIIVVVLGIIFYKASNRNSGYVVPNSYSFSGNILTTVTLYSDISLVVEERDNSIYAVTLKNNELIMEKQLVNNIDYNVINDFGIEISEYNNNNFKDFIYLYDKAEAGNLYKFYEVDKDGNIKNLDIEDISINSNKASLKLTKSDNKYEYKAPSFYYDNYKIPAEVGVYKLKEKSNFSGKTISKSSKIAIDGRFDAIPRKVNILKEIPEYVLNVNSYLLELENKQGIEVDLDGDKQKEYIISFVRDKKTNISLFDSSANFIANLFTADGEHEISDIVEIADIDNNGVMDIIVAKNKLLEVHKYNSGFYY